MNDFHLKIGLFIIRKTVISFGVVWIPSGPIFTWKGVNDCPKGLSDLTTVGMNQTQKKSTPA